MEKLTHSSQKSWSLIHRLGASIRPPGQSRPAVSPNAVASHLLQVTKAPLSKSHRQSVRNEWRQYCRLKTVRLEGDCPEEFTELELDVAIRTVKDGSAAGYENILPEFLKHLGPKAKAWLASFYTRIIREFFFAFPLHGTARYGSLLGGFPLGTVPGTWYFFSTTSAGVPSDPYRYQNMTCKLC